MLVVLFHVTCDSMFFCNVLAYTSTANALLIISHLQKSYNCCRLIVIDKMLAIPMLQTSYALAESYMLMWVMLDRNGRK